MSYAAFDVSASCTGWAVMIDGDIRSMFDRPGWEKVAEVLKLTATSSNWRFYPKANVSLAHGFWVLKSEWTREGEPHAKLHKNLNILHGFSDFEHIFYEESLSQEQRGGASNQGNDITVELNGHVKSFHFIKRLRRLQGIHRASWQKAFIGSQKRGTQRKTITDLFVQRARHLGFSIKKNDEAAAIGILTHGLLISSVTPAWLSEECLIPELVVRT